MTMNNLYIYVKTPPIGHTNVYAHIVEHCVLNRDSLSIRDFYTLCDVKAESYYGYTKYDVYQKFNVEKFIQDISIPLDKKIFKKEVLALKEETKEKKFSDVLKNKVDKLIYNKIKPLRIGDISWDDITSYHKKYYKRESMVICDSNYNILTNNFPVHIAGKWSLGKKQQTTFSINGEKNKIIILPYTHRKSQAFLYFVEFLYDTYMEYTQRYIGGHYNFSTSCMLELGKYLCIAIPQTLPCDISIEFLDEAKKHFCSISLDEYARKIEIINLLYIGQLPTDIEVKEFIQNIDIKMVRQILG